MNWKSIPTALARIVCATFGEAAQQAPLPIQDGQARLQEKTGKSNVFLYYFDEHTQYPAHSSRAGFGSAHASELPYVFRQLREHNRPPATPQDEAVSDMLHLLDQLRQDRRSQRRRPARLAGVRSCQTPDVAHRIRQDEGGSDRNEDGLNALDEYFAWRRTTEVLPSTVKK